MASLREIKIGLEVAEKRLSPDHRLGGAGHDVIWLFPTDIELTDEEKKTLEDANWVFDRTEGWLHYA